MKSGAVLLYSAPLEKYLCFFEREEGQLRATFPFSEEFNPFIV